MIHLAIWGIWLGRCVFFSVRSSSKSKTASHQVPKYKVEPLSATFLSGDSSCPQALAHIANPASVAVVMMIIITTMAIFVCIHMCTIFCSTIHICPHK